MPLAEGRQVSQRLKHIHRVANVIKKNVIEFLVCPESLLEFLLIWKSDRECEGWVPLLRDFDDFRTDINAFARSRPDSRQKIASAAPNRENFFLRLHQKTKQPVE